MDKTIPYIGQYLSLLSAIIWAFAVILLKKSGERVHPIALNLFKTLLGFVLFLPTIWIFNKTLIPQVSYNNYLMFILSGVIGMGIGDVLFLKSLNRIGAGLSAIVSCMYSPFTITLSVIWLKETLTLLQILGVLLIVVAVLTTINLKNREQISRRELLIGILWGVLGIAATAIGIVMIKPLLGQTPLLWAIEIRMFGGLIGIIIITLLHPSRRRIISSLFSSQGLWYKVGGSFLGAYLVMLLWLAGMKFTQVSIASALNQTSSVFIFVFASIFLKEAINLQRILALILAVSGVLLVILG